MVITEVRIKLMEDNNENERLQAFCSVTFDDAFVVRDLKIIEGTKGSFVAMPSRKLTDRCPQCGCKNHLRARFCNQCGAKLDEDRATRDADGRAKLHADIAHPINSACREVIQSRRHQGLTTKRRNAPSSPATSAPTTTYDGDYDDDQLHARWSARLARPAATARTAPTFRAAIMCRLNPPLRRRRRRPARTSRPKASARASCRVRFDAGPECERRRRLAAFRAGFVLSFHLSLFS